MKLNVGSIRSSRIPVALGVCSDDTRLLQWLNEAQEMLLNQGRWWGSIQRAQFCVSNGCITWPREVATFEQVAVCGSPISIENQWYSFTQNLARIESCDGCGSGNCGSGSTCRCGHLAMQDHGTAATFATTLGENKTIRIYPGNAVDVGKTIVVQGYDENRIWVRTGAAGAQIDGELVTLALPYVDTVTTWGAGAPTGIIKQATQFLVRAYEHDTVTDEDRAIAVWEPGETLPTYRQSFIPGFSALNCGSCCEEDADGNTIKTVTALVKLEHVDLVADNDWLVLGNLPAYKSAMIAVKAWEDGNEQLGNLNFYGYQSSPSNGRGVMRVVNRRGAIPLLQAELRNYTSDRFTAYAHIDPTMRFPRQMAGYI